MVKKIAVFCDYGKHVGGGHFRRCEILNQQLLLRGNDSTIFSNTNRLKFSPNFHEIDDYDILIFDTNFCVSDFLRRFEKRKPKLVGLDYFGKGMLDINFVVFPHTEPIAQLELFTGFEYVIIDPIYRQLNHNSNGFGAVVSIGSSDFLGQSHLVSEILTQNGFSVTLIEGPLANAVSKKGNYQVLTDPYNFKEILSCAELVVTNGGGTLFEALHLNRKVIAMPQTRKELNIVNELKYGHTLIRCGLDCVKNVRPESMENFAPGGRHLIDGFGYTRILDHILN